MQRKEITYREHYSRFNKILKSVNNMEIIAFAPDTSDPSFEVQNYAVMIGKNADEIIQNINRYDDANHHNKIFAAANTIKVPENIFVLLTINDSSFVVRCVVREITSSPYRGYSNFKYEVIYETGELYKISKSQKKRIVHSNYYEIRDNLDKYVQLVG